MRWSARVTSTEAAQPAAGWDGEGEKDELRATPTYAKVSHQRLQYGDCEENRVAAAPPHIHSAAHDSAHWESLAAYLRVAGNL